MKKTVAVVVVSLCCWLIASAGSAVCKNLRDSGDRNRGAEISLLTTRRRLSIPFPASTAGA